MSRSPGRLLFRTDGDAFFRDESGGHRWQRTPPTERSDRVHTSTVTVAVMDEARQAFQFDESRMVVEYYKAPGKGGQKRNKCESACRLKYNGIIVTSCDQRHQRQNYESALKVLKDRLKQAHDSSVHAAANDMRREMVGSGQRGDKIRTYRVKDDVVTDHRNDRKMRLSDVMKGRFD